MKTEIKILRENESVRLYAESVLQALQVSGNCRTFRSMLRKKSSEYGSRPINMLMDLCDACVSLWFKLGDREMAIEFDDCGSISVLTVFKNGYHSRLSERYYVQGYDEKGAVCHVYSLYGNILYIERESRKNRTSKTRTVYRYMSEKEFERLMVGEVLENGTDHSKVAHSGSVGFCFLTPMTMIEGGIGSRRSLSAEEMYSVLESLVSVDVLVRFETEETFLTSFGRYADPFSKGDDIFNPALVSIRELSLTRYSRETVRPVAFCRGNGHFLRTYNGNLIVYVGEWKDVHLS